MGTHVSFGGYNLGSQIGVNNAPVTNNFQIPSDLEGKLPMVHEATFNSFEDQHEEDCLPGTRVDVLNQIEDWALSHNSPVGEKCVFWLNGMAGTGKSTISRTIATRFSQANCLGASFFFKRGEGDRGNATKLISTLARQLATNLPDLRPYIEQAVRDDPDIATKGMGKQFKTLIMNPLRALSSRPNPSMTTSVVVIDALDECERDEDIRLILRLLPDLQESNFLRMRVFLTSRPELEIRLGFSKFSNHKDFILHEIPQEVVKHDLSLFLNNRLSKIRTERSLPADWPGESTVYSLVALSSPLFIFAATICRMFEDRAFDPVETLDEIMTSSDNISKLDRTYLPVLKRFLRESYNERFRERLIQGFKQVVGVIIMLESPLSVHSLSMFLNVTEYQIMPRLDLLHSVLSVPRDITLPVRLFHLSFRDFLLDHETIDKTPLWIDAKETHHIMAIRCLSICRDSLWKNICGLPSEGTRRETLSREALNSHLPPHVSYACRYWAYHLVQFLQNCDPAGGSESTHALQDTLSFLKAHFLHWFEAMSLLGLIPDLLGIIDAISNAVSGGQGKHESGILEFLIYARPFVLRYSQVADEAPLQLYCAGLIFSPDNAIRKGFEENLPGWICHSPEVDINWGQEINSFEGHGDPVLKLVFSPDGLLLASISIHAIRLWDLKAGALRHSFQTDLQSELDYCRDSVVFSPDSRLLVSIPHTGPMRLWNIVTGVPQNISLTRLTDIQNVKFSPDSRMLASVSKDGIAFLHRPETDTLERSLRSRSSETAVRIFSSKLFLASGFQDGQVEIVDLVKGIFKPMITHRNGSRIDGMVFSPDGVLLATLGEGGGLVRLWDVMNGMPLSGIVGEWNSSPPRAPPMIFSPDNRTFAFLTWKGIQLHYSKTGRVRSTLDVGSSGKIRELAFSGDGSILVFAESDGRVSLCDRATGKLTRSYKRHAALMSSAALSPSHGGLLMASGGENGTVGLFDLTTPQELNNGVLEIKDMIFSLDGQLLASKSSREVHIWDVLSGTKKHTLPHDFDYDERGRIRSKKKARWEITAMAFNHDSTLLALIDTGEREVLLWNLSKGAPKRTISYKVLLRNTSTGSDNFLAFSPKGLLASSYDDYVVLWDPVTGARLHQWRLHGTLTHLEFTQDGLLLKTSEGDGALYRRSLYRDNRVFLENSLCVKLHVAFDVFRIQGLLRSIGIECGLREICGLKEYISDTARAGNIVVDSETRQNNVASTANSEVEGPQISIEDKQWIVLNGKRAVWLPLEYRPELGGFYKVRVDDSRVMIALGTMSGRVYFIGFDMSSCT